MWRGRTVVFVVLGLIASVCAGRSAAALYGRWRKPSVPELVAAWREAASGVRAESVGVVTARPGDFDSVERMCAISVAWSASPARVVSVTMEDTGPWPETVVASAFASADDKSRLAARGYVRVKGNEFAETWMREGLAPAAPGASVPWWMEIRGLLVVTALFAAGWLAWRRACGISVARASFAGTVLVTVLLGSVALQHPLIPPNGLGVYAGKAKLFLLSHGIPGGFWTDHGYALYQQAYPPGLTALALLFDATNWCCGERLIQLLPVLACALLFLTLTSGRRICWAWVWPALFVLSPLAIRLCSGFYAEPFAALMLAMGWRAAQKGRTALGWTLAGAAGLFRPEGLVLALACWTAGRLLVGRRFAPWTGLALAVLPAVVWQAFCAGVGARVYDFDFTAMPSAMRLMAALGCVATSAFGRFFELGGCALAAPVALVGVLFSGKRRRFLAAGCLAAALAIGAGVVALGFNVSPHFDWLSRETLPRVLWTACVIAVAETGIRVELSGHDRSCLSAGRLL